MERLTIRNSDGSVSQPTSTTIQAVFEKLAAYEDTGLGPEEVKEITSWSYGPFHKKMGDWLKAEQEGRLVVLPCKVGDAVFVTDERTVLPACRIVESVTWWNGKITMRAKNARTGSNYTFGVQDIGKTVFFSRSEAEAAMKGVTDDA